MPRSAFVRLTPSHMEELLSVLGRDPVPNVFLLHLARRSGLRNGRAGISFYGHYNADGQLRGVGAFGPTLLAWTPDSSTLPYLKAEALRRLGEWDGLLGDVRSMDSVWGTLQHHVDPPAENYTERWMALSRDDFTPSPTPRIARIALQRDLSSLLPLRFALFREPQGRILTSYDRERIRRRCEESLVDHHLFFAEEEGHVAFTAAFTAMTPEVTQISSVYTHPDFRGRGLATETLSTLCDRALETSERISLFVAENNAVAQRVYERLGFRRAGAVRSVRLRSGR